MIRSIYVYGGGITALFVLLIFSLTLGYETFDVKTVVQAILDPQDNLDHHVLRGMRMPRAVMAVLAGAALAVAGVLLQTVTRNPLASAGTFGINAGAFFIITAAAVFTPALKSAIPLPLAFLGGIIAAAMAYMLAGGKRGTPVRMALAGMIVGMVLSAFTSSLQLLYENETNGLFLWGSGSLIQNDWLGVRSTWIWIAVVIVLMLRYARTFDLLEMSEDTARSLGQRVDRVRLFALAAAVLLAAVTVSVVGPIGFVGIIAPHLVRLIGIRRHLWLIPASAIWGANVLLLADMAARAVQSTLGELPAGAVTAVIGAPWLIWLAVRGNAGEAPGVPGGSSMSVGSVRSRLPFLLLLALSAAVLAACLVISLSIGAVTVPLNDVIQVLNGGGEPLHRMMIRDLRLPRIMVAALAGAALAVAGTTLQGAVRNPLADPSIVGVTSGAGAGALLLIVAIPGASAGLLPIGALIGAGCSAFIVYLLAWRKGFHPTVLVLVGIAVTALNSAIISCLVIKSGMSAAPALTWLAGSTYARGWAEAGLLLPVLLVLVPAAWLYGRRIDLLAFGDQTSLGLGLKLQQTRLIAAGIGVVLAAFAVSAVGTIGFIGLLAPHAARALAGQNSRRLLLLSGTLGAAMLVVADAVGRVALAPKEIPAGLVVALIGTPYLVFIMMRSKRAARS